MLKAWLILKFGAVYSILSVTWLVALWPLLSGFVLIKIFEYSKLNFRTFSSQETLMIVLKSQLKSRQVRDFSVLIAIFPGICCIWYPAFHMQHMVCHFKLILSWHINYIYLYDIILLQKIQMLQNERRLSILLLQISLENFLQKSSRSRLAFWGSLSNFRISYRSNSNL